jgi:hypothetical protein
MSKAQMPRELRDQLITVQRVAEAIIETVNECPQGAPAGPMYAAMMQFMSLDTFEQMMRLLVEAGRVRKQGHLYFPVKPA